MCCKKWDNHQKYKTFPFAIKLSAHPFRKILPPTLILINISWSSNSRDQVGCHNISMWISKHISTQNLLSTLQLMNWLHAVYDYYLSALRLWGRYGRKVTFSQWEIIKHINWPIIGRDEIDSRNKPSLIVASWAEWGTVLFWTFSNDLSIRNWGGGFFLEGRQLCYMKVRNKALRRTYDRVQIEGSVILEL